MSELTTNSQDQTEVITSSSGGRRLAILGFVAILIAFITSSVSLIIYTASGDIYLDRSRPGFISSDEAKANQTKPPDSQPAIFPPDGIMTKNAINDYLKKLDTILQDVTTDSSAFHSDALSDAALNILDPTPH